MLVLPMRVKSGIIQNTSSTVCDPENVRVAFEDNRYHVPIYLSYNCFRFRARPWHHSSYLASTCSMLTFLFSLSWWTLHFTHWVLEIVFHEPYSRKICTFHYWRSPSWISAGRRCHRKWNHWPEKMGDSRCNFVAISSRCRDIPEVNIPLSQLPANIAKNWLRG